MKRAHWALGRLAVTIFSFSASATALASADGAGCYVGLGRGCSADNVLNDSDVRFERFDGYRFNRYLALEGAVVTLATELGVADLTKDALAIQIIGTLPVSKRFELFAKAGFFNWEVRVDSGEFECFDHYWRLTCYADEHVVDDGTDPAYGIGVEYRLGESWGVRSEWGQFGKVGDGDTDMFSSSRTLRF